MRVPEDVIFHFFFLKKHTDFDQVLLQGGFHFCKEKYIFMLKDSSSRQKICYFATSDLGRIDIG